jgi:hypothetical protein
MGSRVALRYRGTGACGQRRVRIEAGVREVCDCLSDFHGVKSIQLEMRHVVRAWMIIP